MYGIRWKWDGPYAYVVSWYALYTQCTLTGWSHDQDQKTIEGEIFHIEIIRKHFPSLANLIELHAAPTYPIPNTFSAWYSIYYKLLKSNTFNYAPCYK